MQSPGVTAADEPSWLMTPSQAVAKAVSVGMSHGFTRKTVIPCRIASSRILLGDGLFHRCAGPAFLELHDRALLLCACRTSAQIRHETLHILLIFPRITWAALRVEIAGVIELVLGFPPLAGLKNLRQPLALSGRRFTFSVVCVDMSA